MILIIHGNDIISSRNLYFEEKNKAKNPVFLSGDGLTYTQIFQATQNTSLFEDGPTIFIEHFFAKNKANSSEFKEIIAYISKNKELSLVFWENQEVSKSALSQVTTAEIKNFALPQNLFIFLDNLKPQNASFSIKIFHDLLKTTEPELVLFMIIRQFRLLLAVLEQGLETIDEVKRLAPWQKSKMQKQAEFFSKAQLKKSYLKLFKLDLNQKTGKTAVNLTTAIDFFLVDL